MVLCQNQTTLLRSRQALQTQAKVWRNTQVKTNNCVLTLTISPKDQEFTATINYWKALEKQLYSPQVMPGRGRELS